MKIFGHVISFVCPKQLLEPMRSLLTWLHRHFEFKKIEEVNHIYKEIRKKRLVSYSNQYWPKLLVFLTNLVLKKNGHNHLDSRYIGITFLKETVNVYWQKSAYLPFLDITFAETKPHSVKKRWHIINYPYPVTF